MTGLNDVLECEDFGAKVRVILIEKTPELKHIFDEFPFVSLEDVAQRMVQSFVDEYTGYADMEQTLREHADELGDEHERTGIHSHRGRDEHHRSEDSEIARQCIALRMHIGGMQGPWNRME